MASSGKLSSRVVKALSIFSGVQMLQILCAIVRNKFIALWIGPVGVGLIALYNNVIELISSTVQLNMRQSSVRDVAAASNPQQLANTVQTIKTLALRMGLTGAVLTCALSPLISLLTFGDTGKWWTFCLLSCIVVFTSQVGGRLAILQGRGQLRQLAVSSLWGAIGGTVVSIAMYYFFRLAGIIPSLIAFSLCTLIASAYLSRPLIASLPKVRIPWMEAIRSGKGMLRLGFYMTVSSVLTLLMNYVFLLWITRNYGVETTGTYQVGYTLINSYVGVMFTALSMEYYPRMVGVIHSRRATSVASSHEMSVILWAFMVVIPLFIALDRWIVEILYSSEFDAVVPYITLAITGMIFRGVSYCMSYVILARGDGRVYVVTETISVIVGLALHITGFHIAGYLGVGIAYLLWYVAYTIIMGVVYFRRYGLSVNRKIVALIGLSVAVVVVSLAGKTLIGWWVPLVIGLSLVVPAVKFVLRK